MGRYTCRATTNDEFKEIITTLRNGFTDNDGIRHKPNDQVADILVLEANLGCRIGDITSLRHDNFICDNGIWKINIIEEKTNKKRTFIVPKKVKAFIDKLNYGKDGRIFKINEAAVWKQMRAVTDMLGLDNISSHSIRKMVANQIYDNTGHDIEAVSEFLQHSNISTTRTYIRRSDKQLEKAINNVVTIL